MALSGGYDFSQLFHASTLSYSPGSTFIATVHGRRLVVRSTATLAIVRTFQCLGGAASTSRQNDWLSIDQLLWSADSLYIMAFSAKAMTAWIFGLTDEGHGEGGEVARIGGEGVEGLTRVEWGRGGREVLAWSDHGVKLSIWDLSSGHAAYIQHPKSLSTHSYSPDSRYLAVAEKHQSKDFVGVYDAETGYSLLRHFPVVTADLAGLTWSPCGRFIAVYDSILTYALHIYSPLGPLLHSFSPASPSFSLASEDPGLGVRCATWAPSGRWIALGGWDGKVRIVESEGGRCIAQLSWMARTVERDTTVWREPSEWLKETRGRGIVQFNRTTGVTPLPSVRPDLSRSPPRSGIIQMAFDLEGSYLMVRVETQPSVVHIHTFLPNPTAPSPEISHLAVLVFAETVKTARWCSGRRKLAVCTKGGAVYFWDGDGGWVEDGGLIEDGGRVEDGGEEIRGGLMEGVGVPTFGEFSATDAAWSPDGNSLAILDRANSQFCVLYDDPPPEDSTHALATPRRWDGNEGLTHVSEGDEDDRSVLTSLAEAEALWTRHGRMAGGDLRGGG